MATTINTNKNLILNSPSTVSSSSSSMTERSILSEGSIYSNYTDYSNYQELSESLQYLIGQDERRQQHQQQQQQQQQNQWEDIESWLYDSQINDSQQQQLFSKPKLLPLPPPPLEIDISSSSDDQILSPDEFDSIFKSFAAVADGINDYKPLFTGENNNNNGDDDNDLLEALGSFSL